jgi:outer membrane protein OmpA-like peptidoglycan-associated protein
MSINLNQMIQGALTESVLQHIAGRIGCAPESAQRVVSLCGPALIGAMMNKASSLDGARNLFATVMSPATNALIAEELPHFVLRDDGFRSLVDSGAKVDHALASHDNLNMLAERISHYTGVGTGATRTLAGVVCATLFGVLKRYLSQHNGRAEQLPALLGHQLPTVRANMTDAFAHALGLGAVGAFLAGVASRLKAVSAHLEHPATQEAAEFPIHSEPHAVAGQAETEENACRKKWWWVALAAALALLAVLLGRGCTTERSQQPEQDAARAGKSAAASDTTASGVAAVAASGASTPAAAPSKDSAMSFVVDTSGVPTVTASVSSQEEKQRLIDALTAQFGADKFHANITVDPDTKPAAWIGKLDELLPVLTLPGAKADVAGGKIDLSGRAADPALGWTARLKAAFGDGWTVTSSAEPAASASGAPTACSADDVAKNLNLQPINFGFASNSLPAAALAKLAESAKTLKDCHATGKPIQLQIGGYTDNTGDAALNVRLSAKRAQAVRQYLIRHGVPADMLKAEGFGDARPVADNATDAGRSANRRIEFKALG